MSWIDDLANGLIQKAATNVEPGFARYLEKSVKQPLDKKFSLSQRNNQLNAQANKEAMGQVFNQLTGGAALNDLNLAARNTLGNATPEQQEEFLDMTPGQVGLDFAGAAAGLLGPAYIGRGAAAAGGALRNVVQPMQQVGTALQASSPGFQSLQPVMGRGPVNLMNLLRVLGKKAPQEMIQGRTVTGQFSNLIPK